MRLLQTDVASDFVLTEDLVDGTVQPYAILSHTWGKEEVLFQDLNSGQGKAKLGYRKIQLCAQRARADGLHYFWVDTCCINKENSTELAEAINSMFRWYQNAEKCYVFLDDVCASTSTSPGVGIANWTTPLQKSRWFTRGWTLQELIAPRTVEFFSKEGVLLGDKKSLEHQISSITNIPTSVLRDSSTLSEFSYFDRLSWARGRETTRKEDMAYSLLGICGVHMPLIYGEGEESALRRLRRELDDLQMTTTISELVVRDDASKNSSGSSRRRLKARSSTKRRVEVGEHDSPEETADDSQNGPESIRPSKRPRRQSARGKDDDTIDSLVKQSLVEQLYFDQIDERLTGLDRAYGKTCRWMLAKPEYIAWSNMSKWPESGGFIWINGNPGTGKSTLMKLLFEEARSAARRDPSQILLSFFFRARGAFEEKTTEGLYRALLHQLFSTAKDLCDSLEWMTASGAKNIAARGWNEVALKQAMTHAISKLGRRKLIIFVDALDECDQNQIGDLVGFFEELCDHAEEDKVDLRICFSSRHYPTITLRAAAEITLEAEEGHKEDIQLYIKSKLKLGKATKKIEKLRDEILARSSQIFLWVVLVIGILNKEYPNIAMEPIEKIRRRLGKIPERLHELFDMILGRDDSNLGELQMCLKWILFASRPLKPPELYFAVQLGLDKDASTRWNKDDITLEAMRTYASTASRGLAEVTRNKVGEVQLIHESVREFLLDRYGPQWAGTPGSDAEGQCHNELRDCCWREVSATFRDVEGVEEIENTACQEPQEPRRNGEDIRTSHPFVEYAVANVFTHANFAQQHKMDQRGFLGRFPLAQWVPLNNAVEKYTVRCYSETVSLLYVFAERNLADLISAHPGNKSCFENGDERHGPPIFAALATHSYAAVDAIMNAFPWREPSGHLSAHRVGLIAESIKQANSLSRTFAYRKYSSILHNVALQLNEALLAAFATASFADMPRKNESRNPMSYASEFGFMDLAAQLLDRREANVNGSDDDGRTPLSWAAQNGHNAMIRLLLQKGAQVDLGDKHSRTPLLVAVGTGRVETIRLLIENGAQADRKDRSGKTPLAWAARSGHNATILLLLEHGARVDSKDRYGTTPLSWAAERENDDTIRLLLENGAQVNSKDNAGRSPVWHAAQYGRFGIVYLLLENGARLDAEEILVGAEGYDLYYDSIARRVLLRISSSRAAKAKEDHERLPSYYGE